MVRRTAFRLSILVVASFMLGSCTIAKISGRGAVPMFLNAPQAKVDVVKHLEKSKMINFDYTGAIDASEILADELNQSGGDALINVVLTLKVSLPNYLINVVTLGLANSKTFVVSGDIVKAPSGLGLLETPGAELLGSAATVHDLAPYLRNTSMDRPLAIVKVESGFLAVAYNPGCFQPVLP